MRDQRSPRSPLQDGANRANASPLSPRSSLSHRDSRLKKTSLQAPASPPSSPSKIPVLRPLGPRADPASCARPHSSMGFDRSVEFGMTTPRKGKENRDDEYREIKINITRSPTAPTSRRCGRRDSVRDRERPHSALASPVLSKKEKQQQQQQDEKREGLQNAPPRWIVPSANGTAAVASNMRIKTHVGPWKLGCTIGKGTTSRVRVARHTTTGASAAIKIISKRQQPEKEKNKTVLPLGVEREIVIMKLMDHPNILQLLDVWHSASELFLILEHAPAGSLFTYLSSTGALPEPTALRFFRQIIAAMASLHSFNICHRDLKPENILLDAAATNIKIADFGMATFMPPNTSLTTSCGSPHYAAPEVIAAKPYRGDKADLWSCGVILYVMLAGYLPFDSGDVERTLRLVLAGEYVVPPWFGRSTRNLVQSMLRKRPADRLSAREVLKHPAMRKYAREHKKLFPELEELVYGDELLGLKLVDKKREMLPASVEEVDEGIFGAMMILWDGMEKETTLLDNLLNDEVNHEKLFYKGLLDYRTEQVEQNKEFLARGSTTTTTTTTTAAAAKTDDMPMLAFPTTSPVIIKSLKRSGSASTSLPLSRAKSQLYGPRPGPASPTTTPQRQTPKPPTTTKTIPIVPSYDPYRASRVHLIDPNKVEHMKVTIYPPKMEVSPLSRTHSRRFNSRAAMRSGRSRTGLARGLSSKRGVSSGSACVAMPIATTKGKRNVSFQNVRDVSNSIRKNSRENDGIGSGSGIARLSRRASNRLPSSSSSSRPCSRPNAVIPSSNPLTAAAPSPTNSSPTPPPSALHSQQRPGININNDLYVRRKRVTAETVGTPATAPTATATATAASGTQQRSAPMTVPASMTVRQKQYAFLQDATRKASKEIELLCEEAFNRACAQGNGTNKGDNQPGEKSGVMKTIKSGSDSAMRNGVAKGKVMNGASCLTTHHCADGEQTVQRDIVQTTEGSMSPVSRELRSERVLAPREQHSDKDKSRLKNDPNSMSSVTAQPSSSSDESASSSDSSLTSTPTTPLSFQPSSAIKSLLRTKSLAQSKKTSYWSSLEAALKSLETLCPEAPFTSVQVPHSSLAPSSPPTLEELRDLQTRLKKHTMAPSSVGSGRSADFAEIQAIIHRELARVQEGGAETPAQGDGISNDQEEKETSKEKVPLKFTTTTTTTAAAQGPSEPAADIAEWNPNIARLTRRAQDSTSRQASETEGNQGQEGLLTAPAPSSETGSSPKSSIYDDILLDDMRESEAFDESLGVQPLVIRKKRSGLEEEGTQEQSGDEISRVEEPENQEEQEYDYQNGYDLSKFLPHGPAKKPAFQQKLSTIAEQRAPSGESSAPKRTSGNRFFSWSKNDDEGSKSRSKPKNKDGDKGKETEAAPVLPPVTENGGIEGVRRSGSLRRTGSKKGSKRFKALFLRKAAQKRKAGKALNSAIAASAPETSTTTAPEAVVAPAPAPETSTTTPTTTTAPPESGTTLREGSPGTDNQSTSEADSEAAALPVPVPTRQSSRSHSWRLSWMKPAKKVIAFEPDHLKAAKAVRKVLRTWKSYGLKELKFDKEANTFRGKISAKNSFGLAALEFKGRFFAVQESDPTRPGLVAAEHSLLVLKWKSGSSSSLNKVASSLEKSLKEKEGLVITDEEKIKEMRRFCGC